MEVGAPTASNRAAGGSLDEETVQTPYTVS